MEAALREANEEIGVAAHLVTPVKTYLDDHGDWSYHTVIATADIELQAYEMNDESMEVRWIFTMKSELTICIQALPNLGPKFLN